MKYINVIDHLNRSAYESVNGLRSLLFDDILGGQLQVVDESYRFYHDQMTASERTSLYDQIASSIEICSDKCLLDCRKQVLENILLDRDIFRDYFRSLFDGEPNYMVALRFGWMPIHIHAMDGDSTNETVSESLSHNSSMSFGRYEYGGGKGLGFQVYCEDIPVMSIGAGGGGGYEGMPCRGNRSCNYWRSYGGGGGGGLQISPDLVTYHIRRSNSSNSIESLYSNFSDYIRHRKLTGDREELSWISVGGGGGCGVCNQELSSHDRCRHDGDVLCGLMADCGNIIDPANCFTSDPFNCIPISPSDWRNLSSSLASCSRVDVRGGGGGGGGTGECCLPFSIGYGTDFHFTAMNPISFNQRSSVSDISDVNRRIPLDHVIDSYVHNASQSKLEDGSDGDDESQRYQYDSVGRLLHFISLQHGLCGGYGDWCCTCRMLGDIYLKCKSYVDSEDDNPQESTGPNDTDNDSIEGANDTSNIGLDSADSGNINEDTIPMMFSVLGRPIPIDMSKSLCRDLTKSSLSWMPQMQCCNSSQSLNTDTIGTDLKDSNDSRSVSCANNERLWSIDVLTGQLSDDITMIERDLYQQTFAETVDRYRSLDHALDADQCYRWNVSSIHDLEGNSSDDLLSQYNDCLTFGVSFAHMTECREILSRFILANDESMDVTTISDDEARQFTETSGSTQQYNQSTIMPTIVMGSTQPRGKRVWDCDDSWMTSPVFLSVLIYPVVLVYAVLLIRKCINVQ